MSGQMVRRGRRITAVVAGVLTVLLTVDPFGLSAVRAFADDLGTREEEFDDLVESLGLDTPINAEPLTGSWGNVPGAGGVVAPSAVVPEEDEQVVVLSEEEPQTALAFHGLFIEEEPPPPPAPVTLELGGIDVTVAPVTPEATPNVVRLRVAGEEETSDAGVTGVLLDVSDASTDPALDPEVELTVSYETFAGLVHGDWASRLRFVWFPDCETPGAECAPQPLETINDPDAQTVTARVPVIEGDPVVTTLASARSDYSGARAATGGSGGGSLAIMAGSSGDAGDWGATSLAASSTWGTSGSTGAFTWSQPVLVPSVPAGPAPTLGISYSSAGADGRTPAENNQTGQIGEGFTVTEGYVERTYAGCSDDETGSATNIGRISGDLCWGQENATMMFNGSAVELIRDATTGEWHPKVSDGSRIEHITGSSWNTGEANEYWKLTTSDGHQYYFGRGKVSSGGPALNSAWTVPVYGNHPGERCYQPDFADAACEQVWRWNLEYVVDPSGNSMTYFYSTETNRYLYDVTDNTAGNSFTYISAGRLDRIEYGTRAGEETTGAAPAKVTFTYGPRCITDLGDADSFCNSGQTSTAANYWLDTPIDLICSDPTPDTCTTYTPVFFSRTRLSAISTSTYDGAGYRPVDTWTLNQTFDPEGSGISLEFSLNAMLVLRSIVHTGHAATNSTSDDITSPPLTFTYEFFANRVDSPSDGALLIRPRVVAIRTDSGAQVSLSYLTDCGPGDSPGTSETAQAANTRLCFPVRWFPNDGGDPVIEYFHKYVVSTIVESGSAPVLLGEPELITGSVDKLTSFDYQGGAAWAKPTGAMVKPAELTYSDFRGFATVVTTVGVPGEQAHSEVSYYRGTDDTLTAGPIGHTITVDDLDEYRGQAFSSRTYNGATLIAEAVTIPGTPIVVAQNAADETSTRVPTSTSYSFRFDAAGALVDRTRATTTFNADAQVSEVDDRGDLATSADDTCTTINYAHTGNSTLAEKNLLALPSETLVVATACDNTPSLPADQISHVWSSYDSSGRLLQTQRADPTDGVGQILVSEVLGYDALGRALSVADALGNVTTSSYQESGGGLLQSLTTTSPDPDGWGPLPALATTTTFNPLTGRVSSSTDPNGRVTSRTYDALGRLVSVVLPQHQGMPTPSVEYQYVVDPNGLNAIVTKTLGADGETQHVSSVLYDGLLRPFQTQAEGLDAGDNHDADAAARGRMVSHTYYDSAGRVVRVTGQWWATGVPQAAPIVPIAVPPSLTTFEFDASGRQVAEVFWVGTDSNPANERWRTVTAYDGDTTTVIPPIGATPQSSVTDALGRVIEVVEYIRDPDEDASADTLSEVLALPSQSTTYEFGHTGQLVEMQNPAGDSWTFGYDWGGRQVEANDPDSGTTTTTYDTLDRVVTRTNANGETLAYTYDVLGRTTTLRDDSPSGTIRAQWTYDQSVDSEGETLLGLASSATRYLDGDAYTSATTVYDEAYRPLTTTFALPDIAEYSALQSTTFTSEYAYAADGQVTSVALPAIESAGGAKVLGAETVTTRYDSASMPSWMSGGFGWGTYVAQSRFAADGRALAADLGNTYGTYLGYAYEDGTNRLTQIQLNRQGLGDALALSYSYDAAGNVTSITDQYSATAGLQDNQCFGYDGLRRLEVAWTALNADCGIAQGDIDASDVGGAQPYWTEYSYDLRGNRSSMIEHAVTGTPATVTTTYSHGAGSASAHQVTGVTETVSGSPASTTTFEYDAAGNRVERTEGSNVDTYGWDAEGELAVDDDYEYVYDASGGRILRAGDSGTTIYLPGGQEITIDGSTVTANRYYAFGGSTVAVRAGSGLGGVTSLVSDRDGTVVAAVPNTEWTESSVERVYSDPFGGIRGGTDADVPGDHRFLGASHDEGSGLILLGARYYDTALGRFISVDPLLDIGTPAHFNPYAYGYNNPVTFADPSGMKPKDAKKKGGGDNKKGGSNLSSLSNVGGAAPGSTAALIGCPDAWCVAGWGAAVYGQYLLGLGEVAVDLVWSTCGACQIGQYVVNDIIPMFSDWDGYWAGKQAESDAQAEFWAGPEPWGELGNSLWTSFTTELVNNPGHVYGTAVGVVGTFAIPGGGLIKGAGVAAKGAKAATGGVGPVLVGQAGEAAVRGAYAIGPKATVQVNGQTRILDGLNSEAVSEVKNVAYQAYTQQLKDSLTYAQGEGLRFDLYVRGGSNPTMLSGPLQNAVVGGEINLRFIP